MPARTSKGLVNASGAFVCNKAHLISQAGFVDDNRGAAGEPVDPLAAFDELWGAYNPSRNSSCLSFPQPFIESLRCQKSSAQ
ncbi:hypothetical protein SAMN05216288_3730 [Pseudomonas punonensis]|uniref:Uncharacterized protein n=2 Tax=Phytopseudomonas punonensis TaxID=1220495 RepID=A0A1M7J4K0_9GAMM|nr:hypothetical protein SAMN05216288_3730 [Pseudomonas punonensis]